MFFRTWQTWFLVLMASALAVTSPGVTKGAGADFGRVSGTVTDTRGNPLMGATVLIIGPTRAAAADISSGVERVLTDGHGKFTVEHLLPGHYTIQVTSVTRLPASHNSVRVLPGETARETFVLSDIFAPFQIHVPSQSVSTVGEDWKWVLRTSGATRPILRYADNQETSEFKPPLPPAQRLIGIDPGATRRQPLSTDAGMGSVLAYLRPLSEDSDLLVAGSMTANGIEGSSVATAFRKGVLRNDAQELALVMHTMGYSDGFPPRLSASPQAPGGENGLSSAKGIMVSYLRTNRLSRSLTLTAGMEVDYLNAQSDAVITRPRAELEYEVSPSNLLALRYGASASPGDTTLLERVGDLNSFPRVTLLRGRPRLEKSDHIEVSFDHKLTRSSRMELAAYRDSIQDAVVIGLGGPEHWTAVARNALPIPTNDGVAINAGHYASAGFRVVFTQRLSDRVEAGLMYAGGYALAVEPGHPVGGAATGHLDSVLRPERSQVVAAKVSARLPVSHTLVVTSYGWTPPGRVTGVDPYGQAELELVPFLGIQVRQPLPAVAFLPAHIEAIADFRNALAQGYVTLAGAGDEPLALALAPRSFRGGFSVQF